MSDPLIAAVELLSRSGRTFDAQISGTSMGNTLPDGARVRIEPVSSVRCDDVVAFRENERIVAHRVWFRARRYLILVGDGYRIPDPPVKETAVIGRVVAREDHGEWSAVPILERRRYLTTVVVAMAALALLISPRLAETVTRAMIVLRRQAGATSNA
jgi:hypothetical protein